MSELNLGQFSYQRKRSVFNDTGPSQKSTAPTSNQSVSKLNHTSNSKIEGNSNTEKDQNTAIEGNEDWSDQMATLVVMFPSETRLQLVDAITSSSSIEEAVNSVCDNLTANSSSDDNSHSERVTKRKRHFIISDDEDVKCSPKRSRDDDDCVVIDDGDDELEEINDPTDSDSDYTDESPKSKRRNKHLHVPHEISSTNNPNPAQEVDVICLSDEEDTGENDYVQVLNVVDCTSISDNSDDENYNDGEMTTILSFFNDCSIHELAAVPSLSVKKAEKIIKMRPFDSWDDLVSKLDSAPNLSSQLIENCQSLLDERKGVEDLMNKCEEISSKIQDMLTLRLSAVNENSSVNGKIGGTVITSQPKSLNNSLQLKPYQLTSLNWLVLMHEQGVNAILADEMGLGKTVQAIAFLAHLCENGEKGPHLIVVPASTLDNWCREIKTWCSSMDFSMYYGSQEERRLLRIEAEFRRLKPQIVITTYSVANGNDEDRRFLRKLNCNYLVLDEGHMLKNMQSQRYQGLMRMKAQRRLLLTGTPLQNNLLELMSLLSFVMPCMFGESFEGIKMLFSNYGKMSGEPGSNYEKATVAQAKRIMKPFVLRRLKSDVLQQLPAKHDHVIKCELTERQRELYNDSFVNCSKQYKQSGNSSQYNNILMTLRKAANHPLLLRSLYTDETLLEMASKYCKDPAHRDSEPDLVFEDMTVMSDFELHNLCREERRLANHCLQKEVLIKSGKFVYLDALLPELKGKNCRVLLFSQFTMVMDIIEVYLSDRRHRYLRLDGQTSVVERQGLIDKFNDDADIFVFLLSTKAGGLGINLTSANVVILHDIDFNPYNDKQAEDRCHRVGQTREVTVYRLIAKDTIEEAILQCAQSKLRLEQDMAASDKDESASPKDVSELLQEAFNNVLGTIQPC